MGKLVRVCTEDDMAAVARLARQIWHAHYVPIIGQAQVDYMLDKFQSMAAIREQMAHGFEYTRLVDDSTDVGYVAIVPDKDPNVLILSKIYVRRECQKQGAGSQLLIHVEYRCRQLGRQVIRLAVNRHNVESIAWYESKGFVNCGSLVQDIGNGFVMDDFVMEKDLG